MERIHSKLMKMGFLRWGIGHGYKKKQVMLKNVYREVNSDSM